MNTPNDEPRPLERRVGRRTQKKGALALGFSLLTFNNPAQYAETDIASYGPNLT